MANGMTDFEKYPKYRLEQEGIDIQLILNNAIEYLGLNANTKITGTAGEEPSFKQEFGGAEYLRDSNGSPVFLVSSLKPQDAKGIIEVLCGDKITRPVAIGNYVQDEDILKLFDEVGFEGDITHGAELTKLTTPYVVFMPESCPEMHGDIYVYKLLNNSDIEFDLDTTYEYTVTTKAISDTLEDSTYHFYQNQLTEDTLNMLLTSSTVGQQTIKVCALGDYSATQNSDPITVYRVSLGVPVVTSQYTQKINDETVKVYTFREPVSQVNNKNSSIYSFGTVQADTETINNFDTYRLATQVKAYDYKNDQEFIYDEDDNTQIAPSGSSSSETLINTFSLKTGVVLDVWVKAETENTQQIIGEVDESGNETIKIVGNVHVLTPEKVTYSHLNQLTAPPMPTVNPSNGIVYCYHAGSPADDNYVRNIHFKYKIEREETPGSNKYITVSAGTTPAETSSRRLNQPSSYTGFMLNKGDRLTIQSAADYYEDSAETVISYTGNEELPAEINYRFNKDYNITLVEYSDMTEWAAINELFE